jgi:ethanolamine ammonia-lyase large subunit
LLGRIHLLSTILKLKVRGLPPVDRHLTRRAPSTIGMQPSGDPRNKSWPSQGDEQMSRRQFLVMVGAAGTALAGYRVAAKAATSGGTIAVTEVKPGEDVFAYIGRVKGGFDQTLYRQVIGAANDFKEGDQAIGVTAADEVTRSNARVLLANTKIKDLHEHPLLVDDLQ